MGHYGCDFSPKSLIHKRKCPAQGLGIEFLVAWGGIEPPTQGFSI
ncbi:hypothetical protein L512_5181, partial [Bordetella bronchiseptica MBORD624]